MLKRGNHRAVIQVRDDLLNGDTFINYNYTPAAPLLALNETTLLVATTTSNSISRVGLEEGSGAEVARIPVGGWPTGLALTEDKATLLVTRLPFSRVCFLETVESPTPFGG